MKEYIERAALIDDFEHCGTSKEIIKAIVDRINLHPAADVAEVRHAFWSDYGSGVCCTNCGISLFHQEENNNWGIEPSKFAFCPSCGARMGKEAEHETS